MMFESVRLAVTIIAGISGVLWGIKIARLTLSTGIESFQSRLFLSSGIAASIFCALITLGFCGIWTYLTYRHGSVLSHPFELVAVAALLFFPFSAILNFLLTPRRLTKKYSLEHCTNPYICRQIDYLAQMLNINAPAVWTTSKIQVPFVFGGTSKHAAIAIPDQWQQQLPTESVPMLLHELAHIRNKDVGFLGWAFAFIADSGIILGSLTAILIGLMISRTVALPAIKTAYAAVILSVIIIRLMYVLVLRDRELLADRTVAAVLAGRKLVQTIETEQLSLLAASTPGRPYGAPPATRLCAYLADKALFGNYQWFWNALYKCLNSFNVAHPTMQERIKVTQHIYDRAESAKKHFGDYFLFGLALGMILSFGCLGGFWFSKYVLGLGDGVESGQISWYFIYFISLITATVVLINASIPVWASPHATHLNFASFKIIGLPYLWTFLGLVCGSCVIVTNGLYERVTLCTLLFAVGWSFYTLSLVFIFNIMLTGIWIEFRYFSRQHWQEMLGAVWLVAVPLTLIFAILTLGVLLLCSNSTGQLGLIIIFSTIVGLFCTMLFLTTSSYDLTQRYLIIPAGYKTFKIEGDQCDNKGRNLLSLVWGITFTIPGIMTFGVMHSMLPWLKQYFALNIWVGVLLILAPCGVYFLIAHPKRRLGLRRRQLFLLFESCRLVNGGLPAHQSKLLERQLNNFSIKWGWWSILSKASIKSEMLFEVMALNCSNRQVPWLKDVEKFIISCENNKGFALWPDGHSRLSSTYFALSIMQQLGIAPGYPSADHISWIQGCQEQDGTFTDPVNLRPACENTYFALMALNLLGSQLGTPQMQRCREWASSELRPNGNSTDEILRIYHCVAVADMLGTIPDETVKQLWQWMWHQLTNSLLLNPVHDAKSICYILKIHELCCKYNQQPLDESYRESLEILGQKLENAFTAELENLRL